MTTNTDKGAELLAKQARLRAVLQDVRAQVAAELESSRSVSVALTHLDTAELWLARAIGEQSGLSGVEVKLP